MYERDKRFYRESGEIPIYIKCKERRFECMKEIKDFIEKSEKFLITAEDSLNIGDYDSCV